MPLVDLAVAPSSLENARRMYGSGEHNLAQMGLYGLGAASASQVWAKLEKAVSNLDTSNATVNKFIELASDEYERGSYDKASNYLNAAEKASKATGKKSPFNIADGFKVASDAIKGVAPLFGSKKKETTFKPSGPIGGERSETDWTKYALIGGGVLLAGLVTFGVVRAIRGKKQDA